MRRETTLTRHLATKAVLTISIILLCGLFINIFVLNHYWTARLAKLREVHYSGVRNTLLERINMIRAIIDSLSPILPRNVLQQQVLRIVDATRFSDREYFFVGDSRGRFLSARGHSALILPGNTPFGPEYVKKRMQKAINNIIFMEYALQYTTDPRPQKKLGCIIGIPAWQWFIGTGRMVDTIEQQIEKLSRPVHRQFTVFRYVLWGCVILICILFMSLHFLSYKKIRRDLATFGDTFLAMDNPQLKNGQEMQFHFTEFLLFHQDTMRLRTRFLKTLSGLEQMLDEKGSLLKEIHHRVKNNFQIVSSILNIQAIEITDPAFGKLLDRFDARIRAIALTHEQIYNAADLMHVDLKEYLENMMLIFSQHAQDKRGRILHSLDTTKMPVPLEKAIPCALILEELIENAYSHAFPANAAGTITISLHGPEGDRNRHQLCIEDNGCGLPDNISPFTAATVGFTLVRLLVSQLHGELVAGTGLEGKGTRIDVLFP